MLRLHNSDQRISTTTFRSVISSAKKKKEELWIHRTRNDQKQNKSTEYRTKMKWVINNRLLCLLRLQTTPATRMPPFPASQFIRLRKQKKDLSNGKKSKNCRMIGWLLYVTIAVCELPASYVSLREGGFLPGKVKTGHSMYRFIYKQYIRLPSLLPHQYFDKFRVFIENNRLFAFAGQRSF